MCASRRAPAAKAGASPQLYCWASRARSTTPCSVWTRTCSTSPKVSLRGGTRPSRTGGLQRRLSTCGRRRCGIRVECGEVIISAGATLLARPLCTSTDPMSGFFCTTKHSTGKRRAATVGLQGRAGGDGPVPLYYRRRRAHHVSRTDGGRVEAQREAERRVPPAARGALLVRAAVRGPRAAFCLGGSGCVRRVR